MTGAQGGGLGGGGGPVVVIDVAHTLCPNSTSRERYAIVPTTMAIAFPALTMGCGVAANYDARSQ